jgi:RNA polymerase sigma factor (sigma-70 family)
MREILEPTNTILAAAIKKAVTGDGDARAWLYRQYNKAMFNICSRMTGQQSNAEDILQEAFITSFKNLAQLKDPDSYGGWLRRIVVNECIRYSKNNFSWAEWSEEQTETITEAPEEWWSSVSLESLHKEIKLLPEGCRQVFVLYAIEDHSHKDIASELGISESTSKSQYHRARQLLRLRIMKKIAIHG